MPIPPRTVGRLSTEEYIAAAGLAHPLDLGDRRLALRVVLQDDPQDALLAVVDTVIVLDVAFLLENGRDAFAYLGRLHLDLGFAHAARVANSRQHVSYGIAPTHNSILNARLLADRPPGYQLAFLTPGILPSFANVLKQIRQTLNLRYTACDRPQI